MTTALTDDLQRIASLIPKQSKVLDIGCATGDLLCWLTEHKNVQGRGIDICNDAVQTAISRGLSVIQGDVEEYLPDYQDGAYDYIVLNQMLQQMNDPVLVLKHAAKVAKKIIVSVPNFGHLRNRIYFTFQGKMPVTSQLDYEWYETPNIHFCTLKDFTIFADMLGLRIEEQSISTAPAMPKFLRNTSWISNMFGEKGVFLLSAK